MLRACTGAPATEQQTTAAATLRRFNIKTQATILSAPENGLRFQLIVIVVPK